MINRKDNMPVDIKVNMRGGAGEAVLTALSPELPAKMRLFSTITLKPGCGIGYHVHEKDSELFYILKGTATYDDNGTKTTLTAGDLALTPAGTGHSIKNEGAEDVELIALIVFAG